MSTLEIIMICITIIAVAEAVVKIYKSKHKRENESSEELIELKKRIESLEVAVGEKA